MIWLDRVRLALPKRSGGLSRNCHRFEPSGNGSAIGCSSRRREVSARNWSIDGSRTHWPTGRSSVRSNKHWSTRGCVSWSVRQKTALRNHEGTRVLIAMTGRDRSALSNELDASMDQDSVKLGLLMETAQTHQKLAETA